WDFRTIPAIVLFRSGTERDKAVVVFLVGETPTAGVHTTAMSSALRLSRVLLGDSQIGIRPDNEKSSKLRVIGPNFSGSIPSIQHAFQQWCSELTDPVTLHLISGNSTVLTARQSLEKDSGCVRIKTRFHATVLPDDVLDEALYSYLGSI